MSCSLREELWQTIISSDQTEDVDLYLRWRDCTLRVESFRTEGTSVRDIFLEWDNGLGHTGSVMMSATDIVYPGCSPEEPDCLFLTLSGSDPIADFDYQLQYFDTSTYSFRITENPQRRITEGTTGIQNRIIE